MLGTRKPGFHSYLALPAAHHPAVSTAGPSYFDPSQKPSSGAGEGLPDCKVQHVSASGVHSGFSRA